jgi:hypothetical protein
MSDNRLKSLYRPSEIDREDPLGSADELASQKVPDGVDRRTFLMRNALIGATAVITGRPARLAAPPRRGPDGSSFRRRSPS